MAAWQSAAVSGPAATVKSRDICAGGLRVQGLGCGVRAQRQLRGISATFFRQPHASSECKSNSIVAAGVLSGRHSPRACEPWPTPTLSMPRRTRRWRRRLRFCEAARAPLLRDGVLTERAFHACQTTKKLGVHGSLNIALIYNAHATSNQRKFKAIMQA